MYKGGEEPAELSTSATPRGYGGDTLEDDSCAHPRSITAISGPSLDDNRLCLSHPSLAHRAPQAGADTAQVSEVGHCVLQMPLGRRDSDGVRLAAMNVPVMTAARKSAFLCRVSSIPSKEVRPSDIYARIWNRACSKEVRRSKWAADELHLTPSFFRLIEMSENRSRNSATGTLPQTSTEAQVEHQLVRRVLAGETELFTELIQPCETRVRTVIRYATVSTKHGTSSLLVFNTRGRTRRVCLPGRCIRFATAPGCATESRTIR
jgi:hypothetical protein